MDFIVCPRCGKSIPETSHICTHCMAEINRCPQCGAVSTGVDICPECKTVLKQAPKEVQGKKFAIPAFILAMVALSFFISSIITKVEVNVLKDMLHGMSTSDTMYFLVSENYIDLVIKIDVALGIIVALLSMVFSILAWVKLSADFKNGLRPKLFIAFAVIGSVVSVPMLIANICLLV